MSLRSHVLDLVHICCPSRNKSIRLSGFRSVSMTTRRPLGSIFGLSDHECAIAQAATSLPGCLPAPIINRSCLPFPNSPPSLSPPRLFSDCCAFLFLQPQHLFPTSSWSFDRYQNACPKRSFIAVSTFVGPFPQSHLC